jgi:hypothetical protein
MSIPHCKWPKEQFKKATGIPEGDRIKIETETPDNAPETFGDLCKILMPRNIRDDVEFEEVKRVMNWIAVRAETRDQEDYAATLGDLVTMYELDHGLRITNAEIASSLGDVEIISSPRSVRFDDSHFWVELNDGRKLGVPIDWFPRLLRASAEQRQKFELSILGIHWPDLDEDISVEGLLAGRGDVTRALKD